uniref:Vacuolar protein sorting-associated protein 16 homolog n=1 Tax=Petromyzon marinus TaxID=7757 RepID=A0AAJ7WJY4_PETMA
GCCGCCCVEASVNVFRIGSMEPGALLLEASREYESDSQKADEYLRAIREQGSLEVAADECIAAACNHGQARTQKMLLRAAAFGKCFVSAGCAGRSPRGQRPAFVEACRHLRLLNAVRDPAVAMPLTYTQLEHLTIPVLIDRLVARRMFALAVKICELLRLPDPQGRSRVLAHWACYKVESDVPDEALALLMNRRLGDAPGLSYTEIAARATHLGRRDLAVKLLDFEPRAAEQVPLLMKLNRVDLAMMRAIQSGDSDLVYMVISHLKESVTRREFFLTLRQHPTAHSLYLKCCRQLQLETLKDLYEQDDEHEELGRVYVVDGHRHTRMDQRISSLNEAVMEFTRAKNDFATRMTEDQIRLLRVQVKLQEHLVGLSAHDTVHQLLLLHHRGHGRLADTTAKELRLPERRLWWIKVQVLAQRAEWVELEKLSKIKKSPIGYQPFVSECLKHGNCVEARKYIPRLSPEMRVKAYLSAGDMPGAVASALERRCDGDVAAVLSHPLADSHRRLVDTLPRGGAGGQQ